MVIPTGIPTKCRDSYVQEYVMFINNERSLISEQAQRSEQW